MSEKYPENIEIELDRKAIRAYLRTSWILPWFLIIGFFGGMFGAARVTEKIESVDIPDILMIYLKGIGSGIMVSAVISIILYFIFCHFQTNRLAKNLRIRVEGPFLRITHKGFTLVDRKMHFRSIIDYSIVEGVLMRRFHIVALHITAIGARIQVLGIKNCREIRDMLAEIDAIREK